MSVLKTTLTVESTTLYPPLINFTVINNNEISSDNNFGRLVLNSETDTPLNSYKIGSKGAFVYLSSPSSNAAYGAIKIYSNSTINDENPAPIAILYPGDNAFFPVSYKQDGLYAKTTFGSAELNYFFGNRGDDLGATTLVIYPGDTNYMYFLLDAGTSEPTIITDSGMSISNEYSVDIIQNSGYIIGYNNSIILISKEGKIVSHTIPAVNTVNDYGHLQGYGYFWIYNNGDSSGQIFGYFDGENYYTHEFIGSSSLYIDDSFDTISADRTIPLYVDNYNGISSNDATFLIKGNFSKKISEYNYNDTYLYTNTNTYQFANYFTQVIENDDTGFIKGVKIFSSKGVLLKSVDFSDADSLTNYRFEFFGTGRFVMIMYNSDNADIPYTILAYDQSTNVLQGENKDLYHERGSNYNWFQLWSLNYWYDMDVSQTSSNWDSFAIAFFTSANTDWSYFLSHYTPFLDIMYMFPNEDSVRTETVCLDNPTYVNLHTSYNYGLIPTSNDINIFYSDFETVSRTEGSLYVKRLAPIVSSTAFVIIQAMENSTMRKNQELPMPTIIPTGDYRTLSYWNNNDGTVNIAVYNSILLDTFHSTAYYPAGQFAGNNIYHYDFVANKSYYFSTGRNKMTETPSVYSDYWYSDKSPLDGQYNNKLFLIDGFDNSSYFKINILDNGVLLGEQILLSTEPTNMHYCLSQETFVLAYRYGTHGFWKFDVYDNSGNFLYNIETLNKYEDNYQQSGNRNFWTLYNEDGLYTFYNFSIDSIQSESLVLNNYNYVMNDAYYRYE